MANTYVEGAESWPVTAEEAGYLRDRYEAWEEWAEDRDDPSEQGFNLAIDGGDDLELRIWGDEYLNVENVANFLMGFVRDCRCGNVPGDVLTFEWSVRCSKPRPGEFGGGAFAVDSRENVEWMNTGAWAQRKLEEGLRPNDPKGDCALRAAEDAYQWLEDLIGDEVDEEGAERLKGIAKLIHMSKPVPPTKEKGDGDVEGSERPNPGDVGEDRGDL